MSDEDGRLSGLIGAGQRVVEHAGGKGERVEAIRHTLDLAARRFIAVAWLVLVVPILVGPWVLVVYVPLLFERGVDAARDWLGYEGETSRESMLALGALVLLALLLLPDAALSWWPWRWQIGRETWHWLRMPTAWLLVRAVLVIGPLAAWQKAVSHLDNRQIIEVEMPPGSSPASESIQLHNVVIPGWNNPHRNPDDEAEPDARPARIVPVYTNGKARPVEMIEAPSGKRVAKDRLLAMLEEQGGQVPAGFAWREWKANGWTRDEWTAALEILVMMQAVTAPASGQTTRMLADLDDALKAVEAL